MGLSVDRVLDSIEPKDLDEWIAFERIEPDLMETLIGVVKLGFMAVMGAWGADCTPDSFDPRKQKKKEEEIVDASPDQQVAAIIAYRG